MAILKTKDFIKSLLIDELGTLIDKHPYVSFIVMGIGIEFLGKCISDKADHWNKEGESRKNFIEAIQFFPSFRKYGKFLTADELYDSFRCGIAHSVLPKYRITLSSKRDMGHLEEYNGRINLKVENFYEDYKSACEFVIEMDFPLVDKMNRDFMEIPDNAMNSSLEFSGDVPWSFHSNFDQVKASASGAVGPYIIDNHENE